MIRVLLADDHSIVREGLRRIVEESDDMEVVAEAADGKEAIHQIRKSRPDVAVIDISMPEIDGLEVLQQLQPEYPELPILILGISGASHPDTDHARRAAIRCSCH